MSIKINLGNSLFNKQFKIQKLEKENSNLKEEIKKLEDVISNWKTDRSEKEKEWYKKDSQLKLLQLEDMQLRNSVANMK